MLILSAWLHLIDMYYTIVSLSYWLLKVSHVELVPAVKLVLITQAVLIFSFQFQYKIENIWFFSFKKSLYTCEFHVWVEFQLIQTVTKREFPKDILFTNSYMFTVFVRNNIKCRMNKKHSSHIPSLAKLRPKTMTQQTGNHFSTIGNLFNHYMQ